MDPQKIYSNHCVFMSMFLSLAKKENFLELYLGLLYCVKSITNFMISRGIITKEKLQEVDIEIEKAVLNTYVVNKELSIAIEKQEGEDSE